MKEKVREDIEGLEKDRATKAENDKKGYANEEKAYKDAVAETKK
jgi:hypothetical protein